MTGCLMCFELNKEIVLEINSQQWNELNVQSIIEQHLWSMSSFKSKSTWLCSTCWKTLNDFHSFYIRIEGTHQNNECLLKSELKSPALVEQENKYKDFLSGNLLEPEILLDQSTIIIKEENESSTKEDYDTNDDDIPLIHMRKRIDDTPEVPINHNETFLEDDQNPLKISVRCKIKQISSKKPKIYSNKSNHITSENRPDKVDMKQKNKSDPLNSHIQGRKACFQSTMNDRKSCRKSYYQPKTNRQEHDIFLAKHFKLNCCICQKPFETFPLLLKHFSKEHKERGYVTCCQTKYYDRSLLVDHVNYHLNPEYFKCKHCSKVLTQRRGLWAHMKLHEEKQHCCDICGKKFVKKSKLERHKLIHLPEEEKKYPCTVCGKFFGNESILSHHQRVVHLNKYAKLCDICGQSMRDSDSFRRHMEKHIDIRPSSYSCDICGLVVVGKRHLKLHKDSQHPEGGKKEYTCHICLKISPTINALKKHIRCTHEMGYNHKCTICEKAFKRAENLKAHMATHTGTVLYTCPWCSKTFNSNGNMHNHRKKVHPKEWEDARRKKYSGNLPPNFKVPGDINKTANCPSY